MESVANTILKAVIGSGRNSERSKQVNIGPSEIGGCRRKVWYKLNNQESTNPNTLRLASFMGTAIHNAIETALKSQDPFGDSYEMEVEVEHEGLTGHVDLYIPSRGEVVDWKTTKLRNLAYFPSQQQRWQVHLYGYLLEANGKEVKTVTLLAIPRDGDETSVKVHSEPYNREIALNALSWLKEIKDSTRSPAPEKDASFCASYCGYYDATGMVGCPGIGKKDIADSAIIEDPDINQAAQDYIAFGEAEKVYKEKKDGAKAMLEGVTGVTLDGITIKWSSVSGRTTTDEARVIELLGYIPTKQSDSTTRLTIKKGK